MGGVDDSFVQILFNLTQIRKFACLWSARVPFPTGLDEAYEWLCRRQYFNKDGRVGVIVPGGRKRGQRRLHV
jgi:hypothetical protein